MGVDYERVAEEALAIADKHMHTRIPGGAAAIVELVKKHCNPPANHLRDERGVDHRRGETTRNGMGGLTFECFPPPAPPKPGDVPACASCGSLAVRSCDDWLCLNCGNRAPATCPKCEPCGCEDYGPVNCPNKDHDDCGDCPSCGRANRRIT